MRNTLISWSRRNKKSWRLDCKVKVNEIILFLQNKLKNHNQKWWVWPICLNYSVLRDIWECCSIAKKKRESFSCAKSTSSYVTMGDYKNSMLANFLWRENKVKLQLKLSDVNNHPNLWLPSHFMWMHFQLWGECNCSIMHTGNIFLVNKVLQSCILEAS